MYVCASECMRASGLYSWNRKASRGLRCVVRRGASSGQAQHSTCHASGSRPTETILRTCVTCVRVCVHVSTSILCSDMQSTTETEQLHDDQFFCALCKTRTQNVLLCTQKPACPSLLLVAFFGGSRRDALNVKQSKQKGHRFLATVVLA